MDYFDSSGLVTGPASNKKRTKNKNKQPKNNKNLRWTALKEWKLGLFSGFHRNMYMHTETCTCIHTGTCTHIGVCTYTHTGACTHRSTHMHTHISMYMYTQEHVHAHRYSQNKQKMNC